MTEKKIRITGYITILAGAICFLSSILGIFVGSSDFSLEILALTLLAAIFGFSTLVYVKDTLQKKIFISELDQIINENQILETKIKKKELNKTLEG